MRHGTVFFYYGLDKRDEPLPEQDTGGTVGGETIFGRLALMRTKLGLTETELMNSTWISLNLQMADFPYYDPKKKNYVKGAQALSILENYIKK